ncbi:MAG TPA: HoxN/HupN/NixA family nickel/cobalt transporter [Steroidobacteraceae bacterium]
MSVTTIKPRLFALYALLLTANAAVLCWAFVLVSDDIVKLGTAMLAYSLGLRHAVDADHIAAIDNVTRKLMQDGKRPIAVGFFFAAGHSTIVLIAAVGIAFTVGALAQFEAFSRIGGVVATVTSAVFLFVIAAMNLVIFRSVWSRFRHVRAGGTVAADDLDILLSGRGPLSRLFRPLFGLIRHSWQMAPLGFLFGLGFDTATEVTLLGLAGAQASYGLSMSTILVFPALFAAGMALIDTTDGVLMLGAYEWAFIKPIRKLYYNMIITALSAAVAIVIGGIETTALIANKLELEGGGWATAKALAENFNALGFAIVGLFAAAWAISYVVYRWKRFDEIESNGTAAAVPID